jgi:uncharacterized protein (TIGR03435 family)
MEAFDLRSYRVSFAGSNVVRGEDNSRYYDIAALAEGDGTRTKDEFRAMLRTLLEERFNLRIHTETKEMKVYALILAKTGPKLNESPPEAEFNAFIGVHGRNITVTGSKVTMESFANDLTNCFFPQLPVIDKTGLTGAYNLKFEATPEYRINKDPQPEDISLFDAVQDQLGLKLEPQRSGVEVLVVDHIERPSEN